MNEPAPKKHAYLPTLTRVAAVMALVAILPLPYDYYQLLRLVVCVTAVLIAILGPSKFRVPVILLALLFNPVFPVHLHRSPWALLDLGTGVFLLWVGGKVGQSKFQKT